MAFSDETSYTGQQNISTFNGNILIDNARGEIAIRKTGSTNKRTVLDSTGVKSYDVNQLEVVRTGEMPDGTYGSTSAKPGESIQTIYG